MTQSLLQPAKSLQARLLSMVLGLAALVWFSAAVLTWVDTQHELDELLDGHLAQAAALLVVQQAGADDDDHELVDAPSLHKYAPKVAFQVFHDGQLMTRSANAGQQPMATQLAGFSTVRMPDGEQWRVFAAQGAETDIQVFVGEKVESRDAILRAVLRSVFWPLLIALPLLAACARQHLRMLGLLLHVQHCHRPRQVAQVLCAKGVAATVAACTQPSHCLLHHCGH